MEEAQVEEATVSEDALYAEGEAIERPTGAQEKTAKELEEELKKLEGLVAGEDYVPNEAVMLADTREEAEKAAKQYGAELAEYSYGVATLRFPDGVSTEEVFDEVTDSIATLQEAEKALEDAGEEIVSSKRYMGLMEDLKDISDDLAQDVSEIVVEDLPETPIYMNFIAHIDVNPDDPLYDKSDISPKGQWFLKSIDSKGAWDLGIDGSGVKVAVIDSGADTSNNDLSVSKTYNVVEGATPEDDNGHGTHCLGIVGARDNGIGGLGVAPGAELISVKAADYQGSLTGADEAEGIQMAIDAGVDIISMSFGGSGKDTVVEKKLKAAMDKDILCVASAGNNGNSKVQYPAGISGVLVVASYESDGSLSDFSNYGSWVDIAGPGGHVLSTMPDDPDTYLRVKGSFWDTQTSGCSYGKISGTSMSTPAVAGVAALVRQKHPEYTYMQVKEAILNSAPDRTYSYNGHSVKRGVDAKKAVTYEVNGTGGEEKKTDEDWLFNNMGEEFKVKQGKSVALNTATSLDTKKNKLTYKIEDDESDGMITVTKAGVVKVNKKAEVGATAMVAAYCAGYVARNSVIVIPADDETPRFTLDPVSATISTDVDAADHSVTIHMNGGSDDAQKTYKLEITGKGGARFKVGKSAKRGWAYGGSDTDFCTIVAEKAGKVTLTVTATDGSNYSQKVNINVVSPMESVDITYAGVPIRGEYIQMAKGASLQLKAVARGAADGAVSGKMKYTWSGQYVNSKGKVTTPKAGNAFYDDENNYKYINGEKVPYFDVTVNAEDSEGNTKSHTLTVIPIKNKKIGLMGYVIIIKDGVYRFYTSITSNATADGEEYSVGGCYGYSDQNMPDLSRYQFKIGGKWYKMNGPYGFVSKSPKDQAWSYKNNNGQYVISVKGTSVTNVIYGDYGIKGFTPGKKGSYKFIFTALDGSGKTFTVDFKVTGDGGVNSISPSDVIKTPAFN